MKKNLFLLGIISCALLALSGCDSGKTLYGNDNVRLDEMEIEELKTDVLRNRQYVSSVSIQTKLEEKDVSSTVHLSQQLQNSEQNIVLTAHKNRALSSKTTIQTEITSTLTNFVYHEQVENSGWTWLGFNSSENTGAESAYNLYTYSETSHNNGNVSTSYVMKDSDINVDMVDEFWSNYILASFFQIGGSLGFSSTDLVDIFSPSSNYTFISRLDGIVAFVDYTRLAEIDNPLHSGQTLTVLYEYSIGVHFKSHEKFGYVFDTVSSFERRKLLENFENKYLDNPRVFYELSYETVYSYSDSLTILELPYIDTGMSATFQPSLNVFGSSTALSPISTYSEAINLTNVYQSENLVFNGYVYALSISVDSLDYTYAFSTVEDVESSDPIYNRWGFDDLDIVDLPQNLIYLVQTENQTNHFAFSQTGEYCFILSFDDNYELTSAEVLIISLGD